MAFLANMLKNITNINELTHTVILSLSKLLVSPIVSSCGYSPMIRMAQYLSNSRKWGTVHTHAYTNDCHRDMGYLYLRADFCYLQVGRGLEVKGKPYTA